MTRFLRGCIAAVLCLTALGVSAPRAAQERPEYEDDEVYMRLISRTPTQLSAFYQGREFRQAAIDKILETCFVTAIVRNKTLDILWLDLDLWRFSLHGEPIQRIRRDYWREQWEAVGLPQGHRSTFGWTLMPEVRDLRLDESVGGNVVIPWQSRPFSLSATFPTGAGRQGRPKIIEFEDIRCATDGE
jgi:hypothetical protein